MSDLLSAVKSPAGAKVKIRELLEISISGTWLLLDRGEAGRLYASLRSQLEDAEIVRLNVRCNRTISQLVNFPMSRTEARHLMTDMEYFIYGE